LFLSSFFHACWLSVHIIMSKYLHEQSSFWEAASFPASALWNPRVYCRSYKSLSLVSVLSQINPVHALPSCFCKIYLNIVLPSTPRFTTWSAHVIIIYLFIYLFALTIVWDKQKHGECCVCLDC
jgi:hypothetical protein